jgi:RimJ/RimL family protein N-acetyltransferase/uncharacterized glyoxalase superfamily protein PhnB
MAARAASTSATTVWSGSMKSERLETQRLILRPLSLDDAPDLFLVRRDPETVRYWDSGPHTHVDQTRDMIEATLRGQGAWWVICRRDDPAASAIGLIGFLGNPGAPGIGYILRRDHWRKGFGAEALRAVVTYGFNQLGLDRAELWIHEGNVASQRLAESVGFTRRSRFWAKWDHLPSSHEMLVYGLRASDWPDAPTQPERVAFNRVEPILAVPDVLATAEFYRDKLGFAIEFLWGDPPTHAGVARGEWTFPAARIQLSQGETPRPAGTLFIFVGPGIEMLFDDYRARGVEIVSPLERKPWGMVEFTVRDLNGYHLRLGTPA